jgi:ribonuclease J
MIAAVHVSGHACQEELRTMLSLLRPRHVMPIHGEYRMLAAHAKLARDAGVPEERILIAENGSVVELARGGARLVGQDRRRRHVRRRAARRGREGRRPSRPARLADDGVLIVVTTLASSTAARSRRPS